MNQQFELLMFQLWGENEEDLSKARNLITGFFGREQISANIEEAAISSQEEAEQTAERSHIQHPPQIEQLTVEGLTWDVMKAECKISDIIHGVKAS